MNNKLISIGLIPLFGLLFLLPTTYGANSDILFEPGSISVSPNPVEAGKGLTVSVTIKNQGLATAASSKTRLQIKNTANPPLTFADQDYQTPEILSKDTLKQTFTIIIPSSTPPGSYNAYLMLDRYSSAGQGSNGGNDSGASNPFDVRTSGSVPTIEILSATSITSGSATLNARITDTGGSLITEWRFSWGTTPSCSDGSTKDIGGVVVNGDNFSYDLVELPPDFPYYFQAWAKNATGWGNSMPGSFSTSAEAKFLISTSNGDGGTISPSGNLYLEKGKSTTFVATANENWEVEAWLVDNNIVQNDGSTYTLRNISKDTTVNVTFRKTLYELSVKIIGQGSFTLSPPGGRYSAGTKVIATSTPFTGYQFSEWSGIAYSKNSEITIEKGGGIEELILVFSLIPSVGYISTSIANSTPATLNLKIQPQTDWITVFQTANSLSFDAAWVPRTIVSDINNTYNLEPTKNKTQEFCVACIYPKDNTPPFLEFPLKGSDYGGSSHSLHEVISIMDHHLRSWLVSDRQYVNNDSILTYKAEHFLINDVNRRDGTSMVFPGFAKSLGLNYTGAKGLGPTVLNYDSHPGYDYRADEGITEVYPAATGSIVTLNDDMSEIVKKYAENYHGVIIDHKNGFRTAYMHLSSSDHMDMTTDKWIPISGEINTTSFAIGKVGKFLRNANGTTNTSMGPHLHFEVWQKVNGNWAFRDPYGRYTEDGGVIYKSIWK